jgi:hypothetical protein
MQELGVERRMGRAKNSARYRFRFAQSDIRAGFEPHVWQQHHGAAQNRRDFHSPRNEHHGRAEFFALPIRRFAKTSFSFLLAARAVTGQKQ